MKRTNKSKCRHNWKEDPMFASGAMTMVSGSPKDLGEETRMICGKCEAVDYIRIKDLGSILDIYEETKEEELISESGKKKGKNGN